MAVLRKEGTSNLWSTISFRVLSLVICMGPILQMRTLDPEKESDLLTATQLKGREHYPLSHTLSKSSGWFLFRLLFSRRISAYARISIWIATRR